MLNIILENNLYLILVNFHLFIVNWMVSRVLFQIVVALLFQSAERKNYFLKLQYKIVNINYVMETCFLTIPASRECSFTISMLFKISRINSESIKKLEIPIVIST